MNISEALMGKKYPKFETAIYADGNTTIVTVSRTLSPTHVDQDSPSYVETKFKNRLSEPNTIKAIGLDCKPFICTDNEPEETQANA